MCILILCPGVRVWPYGHIHGGTGLPQLRVFISSSPQAQPAESAVSHPRQRASRARFARSWIRNPRQTKRAARIQGQMRRILSLPSHSRTRGKYIVPGQNFPTRSGVKTTESGASTPPPLPRTSTRILSARLLLSAYVHNWIIMSRIILRRLDSIASKALLAVHRRRKTDRTVGSKTYSCV